MDEAPYIPLYTYRKYRIVNVQTFTFNVYMLLSGGLIATTDTRKSKKNTYKNRLKKISVLHKTKTPFADLLPLFSDKSD